MLKYFFLNSFIYFCGAAVINAPLIKLDKVETFPLETETDLWEKWGSHILDFVELVDLDKVMGVVMAHINDPDVVNFLAFVLSPQFKDIVLDFESIKEFEEAIEYLQSKGYNAKAVVDLINSQIETLPYFKDAEIPKARGKGVTDLIEAVTEALPIEDMKHLFEYKLENSPEVAELLKVISSEEIIDILKRLVVNPKYLEMRNVFESYGLDFDRLRVMAVEIFGDYWKKISEKITM